VALAEATQRPYAGSITPGLTVAGTSVD
jgi:hypothetical protein